MLKINLKLFFYYNDYLNNQYIEKFIDNNDIKDAELIDTNQANFLFNKTLNFKFFIKHFGVKVVFVLT